MCEITEGINELREYVLPVLKLISMSKKKTVSDIQLKTIQCVLRSSLKKEIATGKIMRLAMRRTSMKRSQ